MTKEELDAIKKRLQATPSASSSSSSDTVSSAKARLTTGQSAVKSVQDDLNKPQPGFFRKAANMFTGSTQAFGDTLGSAASVATGDTAKQDEAHIVEAENRYKLAQQLRTATPEQAAHIRSQLSQGPNIGTATDVNQTLMKSNEQVFGEGLGTGLEALSGGSFGGAGEAIGAKTLGQAALAGAKTGAGYGLVGGVSQGLQQDKSALGVIGSGLEGAAIGGAAGGVIGGGLHVAAPVISKAAGAIGEAAGNVGRAIGAGGKMVGDVAGNVAGTASKVGQFIEQAPMRLETSAQQAATEAEQLAAHSPQVKRAVVNGVLSRDAQLIEKATPGERKVFQEMHKQAEDFAASRSNKSSADLAGQQLQNRLKEADTVRKEIGQQLGETVKGLKGNDVHTKFSVLDRLQKTQGLEDVRINNKGELDFSDTLISQDTAAQNEISKYWKAMDGRDAHGQHKLRQEIFEALGGRQKARVPLTATEEQGLEAIRQGLSDSLDNVSPAYKALNQKYAQVAQPMMKLRRFFKGLDGANQDILDESSGTLMRRLTSNVRSGSELKQIISEVDSVLAQSGKKSDVNLQNIQDFQNALERYYDITKDTGFAGQTSLGIQKGGGFVERGINYLESKVQASPEVKQRMIKELLNAGPKKP